MSVYPVRKDYAMKTTTATASLILGILAYTCCGPFFSVPAVILGHVALSKIRRGEEAESGRGMAVAGLVLGYLNIALAALLVLFYVSLLVIAAIASAIP